MSCSISLLNNETKLRVSSVLNKDTKSYGKQFLSDGKEETCWNSDQGENQWIVISFPKPVEISGVELKFQGGFCSAHVRLEKQAQHAFEKVADFYPQDINSAQVFEVNEAQSASDCYRLFFSKLTDFFGRLIIYDLRLYGSQSDE